MNKILDWYFNSDKFTYGSRVSLYNDKYIIIIGRDKFYVDANFKKALIKSTNNLFFKLIFTIFEFNIRGGYFRNEFSGSISKSNWKKLHGCTHLAWETGGGFNREHKYITKI